MSTYCHPGDCKCRKATTTELSEIHLEVLKVLNILTLSIRVLVNTTTCEYLLVLLVEKLYTLFAQLCTD